MRNGEALVYAYVLDGKGGGKVVDWSAVDDLYCGYITEMKKLNSERFAQIQYD